MATALENPHPVVDLERVTKSFGARLVVDALSLQVPRGACFGLLGPNGAGKTTALRMVYGVTRPDSGSIRVFGIDVGSDPRQVRSRLGVTLQENALIEPLTPVENLAVFGRFHLLTEREIRSRTEELLDFLELRSHADVPVRALSGGFQRRLSIAQSLMNRPELLILDEPTTGLDPAVRISLWSRVDQLRALGTTVLLTTHYMEEAERLCDQLVILDGGKAVAQGSPEELIDRVLAAEALELDVRPEEDAAIVAAFGAKRSLRAGSRLILYADDAGELALRLREQRPEHRARAVRRTNLEDVFLALTGAQLEFGA